MLQINNFSWRVGTLSCFVLIITISLATTFKAVQNVAIGQSSTDITLRYEIDRSQVPTLYFNDLTLNVLVGQVDSVQVAANGTTLAHQYNSASGMVSFTTDATQVDIELTGVESIPNLAAVTKATLKDNKNFAWSLGMDDNVGLKEAIDVMESYGWAGTLFMISEKIDDTRDEDWTIDAPYLKEKFENGWSIGNHGWTSTCATDITEQARSQDVTDGYTRLRQIIDSSTVPDYQTISFAAPCFVGEYHPLILNHRDAQVWPVQFNESGARSTLILDPDATDDIVNEDFTRFANVFDYDLPVGRDGNLDASDTQYVIDYIDWIAEQYTDSGLHLWHNSLIHGDKQDAVNTVASYLYNTYGPNGTDQLWVAPSDQVYSYLLVRDRSVVRLVNSNELPDTPTPTPTNTPTLTNTPTATNTFTPTHTPTNTPTHTPTFTPTNTPTPTSSPTATNTPTRILPTHTPTFTPSPTASPTAVITQQPTSSGSLPWWLRLPIVSQGESK